MATNKQGIKEYHPFSLMTIGKGKTKLEANKRFTLCFDFVAEVSQRETCVDQLSGKEVFPNMRMSFDTTRQCCKTSSSGKVTSLPGPIRGGTP
jgi:hypothetical protein